MENHKENLPVHPKLQKKWASCGVSRVFEPKAYGEFIRNTKKGERGYEKPKEDTSKVDNNE